MGVNLQAVQQEEQQRFRADDTLPDGTYTFLLIEKDLGITKKGDPKITLDWRVTTGQWTGASVRDTLTFTVPALFRVNMLLEAIGIPIPTRDFETMYDLREWVFGYLKVMQTRVEGVTNRRPYKNGFGQDRISVDINQYQQPPGGNETPAPETDVPAQPEQFQHPKPPEDAKPLPF